MRRSSPVTEITGDAFPMQHYSQLEAHMTVALPAERASALASLVLFASLALVALAFIPIVPPEDVLEGGGTTLRGGIELGLVLAAMCLLGIYARAKDAFAFDLSAPAFLLINLFTFWAVVSSLWSPNAVLTIAKSAELWCITLVASMSIAIAVRAFDSPEKFLTILALALVAVIAVLVVMNLFIWGALLPTTGDASLPLELIGEDGPAIERPRLILAYAHPLLTGDFMSLTIICLFASAMGRLWKCILSAALLVLLWMADARGPMGGLLVALVAMSVLKLRRNDMRAIVLMLAVSVCLGMAMVFQDNLPGIFSPLMTDDVATLNSRTGLWTKALGYILERPLAGFGYYSSRYLLIRDFPWAGHAHNSFIEITLTTGLVGLTILCAFVVYLFRSILTTKNSLLLGATIYCLIQGMLNPLLFYAGLPMFVIAIAVLSAGWTSRTADVNSISYIEAA